MPVRQQPDRVRLLYFGGRARAELARLVLAAGGVNYENVRMEQDEFKKIKESLPFGQLPVLEWGPDLTVAQSVAIARFVARQCGLAGNDAVEDAKIDMIVDHVQDHFNSFVPIFGAKDEAVKKELCQKSLKEKIPYFLKKSEEMLKKAGGEYLVGNRLTWADLALMERLSALSDPDDPMMANYFDPNLNCNKQRVQLLEEYPLLKLYTQRIRSVPSIKHWMDVERPASKAEKF